MRSLDLPMQGRKRDPDQTLAVAAAVALRMRGPYRVTYCAHCRARASYGLRSAQRVQRLGCIGGYRRFGGIVGCKKILLV